VELVVIGLSHQTAPVEVRERLAVIPAEIEAHLQTLLKLPGVTEVALVSTCNRVEVYAASSDARAALGALRDHLHGGLAGSRSTGAGNDPELDRHLYERVGREAIHHLFRVAASLDSLVVGEPQILGQIKDAYDLALRARTAGQVLGSAFPWAFRVARKVRRDTAIARQPVSVSSVAVDLARQVWSGFEGRRVLVVGAGKMSDLATRALRASGATVAVTNRTAARAEELAQRLGCSVEPFGDLEGALGRADIVITSTGARQPILGLALLERVQKARRRRPLVLIDIAVPRDVDPAVDSLEGIYRWDIDNLQKVVAQNLEGRQQEADRAEALVDDELARCLAARRGHAIGPTITALRSRYLGVARAEAEKVAAGWQGLDDRSRRALSSMAEAIVNKLLHAPQVALKKSAASDDGETLLAAAHTLFDLPVVEALGDPPPDADAEDAPAAARADWDDGAGRKTGPA
jgi:glutamyl-tRNA reductase